VERLTPVLDAVVACPAQDHSAAAMANRIGVSVRHLGRLFAQHAGVTPARYVELVRVAAAEALLTGGRAPLSEVATQAGFGSAETMRRAFLRTVRVTPGAYRRRRMSRSEGDLSLRPGPNRRTLSLEVKARPNMGQPHPEYLHTQVLAADLTSQTRSADWPQQRR
jgi:AraC-like DNA-binding protein